MTNNDKLDNLIQDTAALGKKLGILINALNIPDEYKSAIMEILPEFSYEQLVQFVLVLEDAYAKQQTSGLDEEFFQNIQNIQNQYIEKRQQSNQQLKDDLSDLEKDLDEMLK